MSSMPDSYTWMQILGTLLSAWVFYAVLTKLNGILSAFKHLSDCPGRGLLWIHPFHPTSQLAAVVYPFKGWIGHYYGNFAMYAKYRSACISSVLVPKGVPIFWVADAPSIQVVSTDKTAFDKDMGFYKKGLEFYGPNIIASQTAGWKRHRVVSNPAFNESLNAFVWQETVRSVAGWLVEKDPGTDSEFPIQTVPSFSKLALSIFVRAGFGLAEGSTDQDKLLKTLRAVFDNSAIRGIIPDWIFTLTSAVYIPVISPYLRETLRVYDDFERMSMEAVSNARADVVGKSKVMGASGALLRNLVKANLDVYDNEKAEGDRTRNMLTDRELISDMFMFFGAGYETTANTMSFICAVLALYPDIQQKVFEETKSIWPNGAPTDVDEADHKQTFPSLIYCTAVFRESLRLYPIVSRLGRVVIKDTILRSYRLNASDEPEPFDVPIKKGSEVVLDLAAVHRNPIYWGADAEEFKPERFIDTDSYRWPRDAFLGFSAGYRNCIGQKFAVVEGVCMLAHIARGYEILVPKHLRDRPFEEQRTHMLKWRPFLTNSVVNPEVVFCRRS
ncbi:hypothetical protein D9758_008567 [Tetrapyrgos nigripes]|uniref:Cytochrome P450 n=1 Tax=Tetrapyrgos nigripes TaxID=182062 RepID=A0A8H5LIJ7_9AGAR|nr:hypothetical protein D9758_008567 [Tetrapyrgos nigripes]